MTNTSVNAAPGSWAEHKFFDACRQGVMGPTLDNQEVKGTKSILIAMAGAPVSYCAYALATSWLETGNTMHPVKEANWLSDEAANRYFTRMYDITGQRPAKARELGNLTPGDGAKYAGRGYVQLTGRTNYATAERETGFPLLAHPDLAMREDIAAIIMRKGMELGWFTRKKFRDYLPSTGPASREGFISSRRIINGTDRARDIANFALSFQSALIEAGWGKA